MAGKSAASYTAATSRCARRARRQRPHRVVSHTGSVATTGESQAALACAALLAGLTHELRTPVSALATGSELLLEDLDRLSRDDLLRIVQAMHRGAMWLQGLVENVLFAATLAEGALRIHPRPLDLAELARDIVPVVDPLLRQRRQTLRIVDCLGGTLTSADSRRMGQVLVNLVGNASKYGGPGTTIEVRLARRAGAVRLSVADRGPGLPPGSAEELFGPYSRAVTAGQTGIDGAGLGLSIVRSIAELHGGAAGASRRRGGGAVFWVELPLAPAETTALAESSLLARERLA